MPASTSPASQPDSFHASHTVAALAGSPPSSASASVPALRLVGLVKAFDRKVAVDRLSLDIPVSSFYGIVGPNGVGKTTLFKTIVGLEGLDGGELRIGKTVKLSYVDQDRAGIDPKKTLWEVVSDGLDYIKVGNVEMPSRAYRYIKN